MVFSLSLLTLVTEYVMPRASVLLTLNYYCVNAPLTAFVDIEEISKAYKLQISEELWGGRKYGKLLSNKWRKYRGHTHTISTMLLE